MQSAQGTSPTDTFAPRRVRLSMLLMLALIAVVVVFQNWLSRQAEASRSTDAEIINLAAAQRTHSQRIARLVYQSASDTAQIELDMVLTGMEAQALELERLLAAQGVMAAEPGSLDRDRLTPFREAVRTWQVARQQFLTAAGRFVHVREIYDFAEIPRATSAVQKQADAYFLKSQLLVEQAQAFAQNHGDMARQSSLVWTGLIVTLLGLLAAGVVEPTARFVRRQYDLLRAQASEVQRLALVAAHTSNWVAMTDMRQKVVWANQAFLAGFGLPVEQVLGKGLRVFLSPDGNDIEELDRAAEELKQGLGVRVDVFVRTQDGQGVWLDLDCQPVLDDQKAITGFLVVGNDITNEVMQRRKLETLFNTLPVGVVLYNKAGVVVDCNPAAMKMTQLQMHEFANYETMVPSSSKEHPGVRTVREDLTDYPMVDHPVVRVLKTKSGLRRESVGYLGPSGAVFWIMVNAEPMVDAQGQLSGVVECFMDVSRQKKLEQRLLDMSRTDGLTQLPNRVVVMDQIRAALARRHAEPGYHFAVLFMDFDPFKQVNDTLGHVVGDELLRQIAHRLQTSLRPGDAFVRTSDFGQMAARIGGDEFVVVLDDIRGDLDAEVVAGRLLEVLAAPYQIGDHTVNSSVSIGIVTATHAVDDVESVLRDADIAMYEAKRTGRGRYVMFEPSMHRRVRDDVSLENDLRQALAENALSVVYQPLVDLNSGALTGMEALVRWKHPQRGMVSPAEFIPVAEASGLIVKVGAFVLHTACAEFAWLKSTLGPDAPPSVSVNLSRAQLRESDLVSNILETLRANSMAASQLQLEITESLAAQDQVIQSRLREIKALGVTLALDDFGTGYSSLSCLAELPIDTVKIDRAFVSVAQASDYHRVLIEATILVAETLGMTTVAEGIETAEQAAMMKKLRCTKGQGYLYSKPLSCDALVNWIEALRAVA
jgi:diguanylate cyclase (GGDEF)-like protein/PAS domain S-box-containing protein